MKLGMEVGLGPSHIVLDGDPALQKNGTQPPPPIFGPCLLWPNGWIHQDANLYGGSFGPGDNVLDGDPALPKKEPSPQFLAHVCCGQTVAHLSYC